MRYDKYIKIPRPPAPPLPLRLRGGRDAGDGKPGDCARHDSAGIGEGWVEYADG